MLCGKFGLIIVVFMYSTVERCHRSKSLTLMMPVVTQMARSFVTVLIFPVSE